jgi:hypothetical protein
MAIAYFFPSTKKSSQNSLSSIKLSWFIKGFFGGDVCNEKSKAEG